MKNRTVIIIMLFFSVTGYAQKDFEAETFFGVKAGGNISGIFSDPTVDQEIYNGLNGGIIFKYIGQKNLGIQVELNYKQSGWNESLDSTNIYKRRLDFIELPFMTHINFGTNKTRILLNVGPYVSYLLSEKEQIELLEEFEEKKYYGQQIDNRAMFGLCLGFGISRNTSIGLFQLESRITTSLTNGFNNMSGSYFSSSQILNGEISLFYMIEYKSLRKFFKI